MESSKINTRLNIEIVNGIEVAYGRIPSNLIQGFSGIVFYFQTDNAYDTKAHEDAIRPLLSRIVDESYDHGVYWKQTKTECVEWTETSQISIVSFRVRDSY